MGFNRENSNFSIIFFIMCDSPFRATCFRIPIQDPHHNYIRRKNQPSHMHAILHLKGEDESVTVSARLYLGVIIWGQRDSRLYCLKASITCCFSTEINLAKIFKEPRCPFRLSLPSEED